MASGWYGTGLMEVMDGTIDLDSDTLKLMLVNENYTFDGDHDVIDNGDDDGTDPSFNELVATGYVGGYNGAGRKTATISLQVNKTDNRVEGIVNDVTWSEIGGAVNGTIHGAILVKEGANDTDSRLIAFFDITNTPTNGGDITFDYLTGPNGGNLRISY